MRTQLRVALVLCSACDAASAHCTHFLRCTARLCAPLQEIAEVIIENEKQLDDSAENF
jgi:hypothetical protein